LGCGQKGREGPEKWRTNSWFLVYDNAPAHRSVMDKDFFAVNNVKHWSILHILLTWIQLFFTLFLE
jgi:hypothetical protein